ncbi:MAG: hypothetical protein COV29_00165 [Candidatus Yanofskybacteria bacterium CG10_big_fil_rev_8_21_14_0_10_36_16]|uniref:UDP-N-acetylmuramate--L-alanine ligase n=1 Tax=Candidatus Yanofskybacteria bacterium CG10_big_fil_rev_8_21_14_0_10_36_16 TaxID=1975096 RepID=A0A2J0Q8H8_9BACT|nr:MAG: hypothetical protein COV29_00165 [Candidatus Yanofskybacteria bacterium CG10_big_fil_rev_8_21_14_0_10_36_16]
MDKKIIDLSKIRNIYMIGIKGTGMAPLAVNLKNMGKIITGSDSSQVFFTDELLKKQKINILSPFKAGNIPSDVDLVITSTAYDSKNPEIKEAETRGLSVLGYPEVIGLLSNSMKSVAVCGSHGKTTTTAVLSYILSRSNIGVLPNVGSIVPQLINYKPDFPSGLINLEKSEAKSSIDTRRTDGTSSVNAKILTKEFVKPEGIGSKDLALAGHNLSQVNMPWFVFEADEYQNKLRHYSADIVILTNIDYDHPDFFKTLNEYKKVFVDFVKRIPKDGLLIYCSDDKEASKISIYAKCPKIAYNLELLDLSKWEIKLAGQHNILNTMAAILAAKHLGVDEDTIKKAVANFQGVKRRLEFIKNTRINGQDCVLIDDYGHHPTEIKASIKAIKEKYPNKVLWTVFQPHTFSRTSALFDDFAKSFKESDKTVVLDIYTSAREKSGSIHSRDLVKQMNSSNVFYKKDIQQTAKFLKQKINSPSVIMTIGASNVWELHELV